MYMLSLLLCPKSWSNWSVHIHCKSNLRSSLAVGCDDDSRVFLFLFLFLFLLSSSPSKNTLASAYWKHSSISQYTHALTHSRTPTHTPSHTHRHMHCLNLRRRHTEPHTDTSSDNNLKRLAIHVSIQMISIPGAEGLKTHFPSLDAR